MCLCATRTKGKKILLITKDDLSLLRVSGGFAQAFMMVIVPDSRLSNPCSSSGQGHCVVFSSEQDT